jgi:hypothetical protein
MRAIVTGIMPLAEDIAPTKGLKKLTVLDHLYARHYCLNRLDMDYLFSLFQVDTFYQELMMRKYNGYVVNSGLACNTWSVINCLNIYTDLGPSVSTLKSNEARILKNYWIDTGELEHVIHLFSDRNIFDALLKLTQPDDNIISFKLTRLFTHQKMSQLQEILLESEKSKSRCIFLSSEQIDLLFSYLFLFGYLTQMENDESLADGQIKARIPNEEVRQEFRKRLNNFTRTN